MPGAKMTDDRLGEILNRNDKGWYSDGDVIHELTDYVRWLRIKVDTLNAYLKKTREKK